MNTEKTNGKVAEGEELHIEMQSFDDSWDYHSIALPADLPPAKLTVALNELGAQGWELKTSWVVSGQVRLVFAR